MIAVFSLRIAVIASLLGIWDAFPRFGFVDPQLLPPIGDIVGAMLRQLGDPEFRHQIYITGSRVILAFVVAAPIAIVIGTISGESDRLRRIVNPIAYFGLAVPQSIFLPMFTLLFGIGALQKVAFGITHVLFVATLAALVGMRSIPSGFGRLGRSLGATKAQTFFKFYLPAMSPYICNGLRVGLIFDLTGVLLAEMYSSRDGLGLLIVTWSENFKTKEMLAAICLISACTILLNELLRLLETRLGRWRVVAK